MEFSEIQKLILLVMVLCLVHSSISFLKDKLYIGFFTTILMAIVHLVLLYLSTPEFSNRIFMALFLRAFWSDTINKDEVEIVPLNIILGLALAFNLLVHY